MKINYSRVVSLLILGGFVGLGVLPVVFAEGTGEPLTNTYTGPNAAKNYQMQNELRVANGLKPLDIPAEPVSTPTTATPAITTTIPDSRTGEISADVQSKLDTIKT